MIEHDQSLTALERELTPADRMLLIEDNMSVAREVADYVTVLNRGEILPEGTNH